MTFERVSLFLCLIGWFGALALVRRHRTLPRLFGFMIMSIWLYVSILLVVFTLNPRLEVWLFLGFLPLAVVAYGYRIYDHRQAQAESDAVESKPIETNDLG